jgi:hypothetical protein
MTRQWGWAPKGERIAEATPQGRWKVLTTLGAMTIESATDGDVFTVYVEQVLCAALRPGDVVVRDSLSAHEVAGIRELIESNGARALWCLFSIVSDITIIYFPGEAVGGYSFDDGRREGAEAVSAPQQVRRAIDDFVAACNPTDPPFEWAKTALHPSAPKRSYADLCSRYWLVGFPLQWFLMESSR